MVPVRHEAQPERALGDDVIALLGVGVMDTAWNVPGVVPTDGLQQLQFGWRRVVVRMEHCQRHSFLVSL